MNETFALLAKELAGLSEWTLAVLPRLFLFPGGLWLLCALLGLRFASGGISGLKPAALLAGLSEANLTALATAWAAVSIMPFPGAVPLPFPVDRLALAGLLALSFVLDSPIIRSKAWLAIGITLAVMAPVAGGRSLLAPSAQSASAWLSLFAVGVGLVAMIGQVERDLAGAVRWLGWLGLGAMPLWGWAQMPLPGILLVSAVYLFVIVVVGGLLHSRGVRGRAGGVVGVAWGLAALSLLAALLHV